MGTIIMNGERERIFNEVVFSIFSIDWVVMPCGPADDCQRFDGIGGLHVHTNFKARTIRDSNAVL